MGLLYFVQPTELIGTSRFKIGRSSKNSFKRLHSYRKGTRIILTASCDDHKVVEAELIDAFNSEFTLIAGNEFFHGKEEDMVALFKTVIAGRAVLMSSFPRGKEVIYQEKLMTKVELRKLLKLGENRE